MFPATKPKTEDWIQKDIYVYMDGLLPKKKALVSIKDVPECFDEYWSSFLQIFHFMEA